MPTGRRSPRALILRARTAPSRFICLGDYVGYGADPEWTVETVMGLVENGALAVRGNHDNAVGTPVRIHECRGPGRDRVDPRQAQRGAAAFPGGIAVDAAGG